MWFLGLDESNQRIATDMNGELNLRVSVLWEIPRIRPTNHGDEAAACESV